MKAARYELLFPYVFPAKETSCNSREHEGSTPKHVAKCLVPEPDASSLFYTRAKKRRKSREGVTLYLFFPPVPGAP